MTSSVFAKCWFLTGATASGKTKVGIELAKQLDAEIVSLDSMAVYRGMDIGTAKPSTDEKSRAVHHLIDIVSPDEDFSIAQYLAAAERVVGEIHDRGNQVLFVGGTPLYLKAALRGLSTGPPPDWEFREQVAKEVEQTGHAALHQRLRQVDPLSAAKIHSNDIKRIIRALEVHKLTGQPISHQQTEFDEGTPAENCRVFVLHWERSALHSRIDARVHEIFEKGIVAEVQSLTNQYHRLSRTASHAVGYREVLEHLQGIYDLEQTIESVKIRTHRFAKHQETWFRSLSECRRYAMNSGFDPQEMAVKIAQLGETST